MSVFCGSNDFPHVEGKTSRHKWQGQALDDVEAINSTIFSTPNQQKCS